MGFKVFQTKNWVYVGQVSLKSQLIGVYADICLEKLKRVVHETQNSNINFALFLEPFSSSGSSQMGS